MRYPKIIIFIIFCFIASFALEAQKITFSPQWSAQSQFAGYYVAKKMGYYKEAGLAVDITYPNISENPNSKLTDKTSDIVTMNLKQALFYRANGYKIVNIMQLSHHSSLWIVTHFPVKGLQSFNGKKVGIWNYLDHQLINRLKRKYGAEIELVRFNYGVNLFLSKAIDATIASSYDELIQLRQCGFVFTQSNVVDLSKIGFNISEDGLYVTEEYYNKNKEVINKFVNATKKGWLWTRNNRKEAVDITIEEMNKNSVPTNRYIQQNMLDEILRLQQYDSSKKDAFILSEAEFNKAYNLFFDKPNVNIQQITYDSFVKP